MALIARSGSFSPCPVNTHTTRDPSGTPCLMRPATDAEDAASQKTDSWRAKKVYASMISSSVTAEMDPPDSDAAAVAEYQPAGLPIRIAVAIVSGFSTGWPRTMGAAPAAWKPSMRGSLLDRPAVLVLEVTTPVRRDIPGVAHRDAVHVWRVAQDVDDLEGARLLSLYPLRVDRIDDRDRRVVGEVADDGEQLVEIPPNLEDPCAVHQGLRQLAQCDVALGDEDHAGEARP